MFSQACVILFRGGGGSASVHGGIPPGSRHPPPPSIHPPGSRLPRRRACWEIRSTWAVRILLECNLVLFIIPRPSIHQGSNRMTVNITDCFVGIIQYPITHQVRKFTMIDHFGRNKIVETYQGIRVSG